MASKSFETKLLQQLKFAINLFRLAAINLAMEYTYRFEDFSFELLKIVLEICRSEHFIYFKSSVQYPAQILFSLDLGFFSGGLRLLRQQFVYCAQNHSDLLFLLPF